MIYTEYFSRGTEPTNSCDLHPPHGIMANLAGLFGVGEDRPAPPRVEDTGLAPAVALYSPTLDCAGRRSGLDPLS